MKVMDAAMDHVIRTMFERNNIDKIKITPYNKCAKDGNNAASDIRRGQVKGDTIQSVVLKCKQIV